MARIFGILGVVAAVAYYIFFDPSRHPANAWSIVNVGKIVIYGAVGFVVGWVVGNLISMIGHRDM